MPFFRSGASHVTAACTDCHVNGRYQGTSHECVACHLKDYQATRDPNHAQAGYSTDCVPLPRYRSPVLGRSRGQSRVFLLKGRHQTTACTDCHVEWQLPGDSPRMPGRAISKSTMPLPTPTTAPSAIPTDCVPCHGDGALTWQNATVNHDQYWPLKGPHGTLSCASATTGSAKPPQDCYGCHRANYDATRSPNHKQAGFPTACDNCHLPSHVYWTQAVFNHKFPINSGKHSGFACTDCHLTSNYLVFSCIDCHTHNRSSVDGEHRDVRGYSYSSQACYGCHPHRARRLEGRDRAR